MTVWVPTQAESIARDVAAQVAGVGTDAGDGAPHVPRRRLRPPRRDGLRQPRGRRGEGVPGPRRSSSCTRARKTCAPTCTGRRRWRASAAALDDAGRLQALDYVIVSQSVIASYCAAATRCRGRAIRARTRRRLSGAVEPDLLGHSEPALRVRAAGMPACRSVSGAASAIRTTASSSSRSWTNSPQPRGQDPVEFRLAHLADRPAHQAVLREAARRSGWGTPLADGPRARRRADREPRQHRGAGGRGDGR